jgi:hypothetical protein
MKIQRLKKGEYGYPIYEQNVVIVRTAVYFLISIAVFLLGYFSTGSKENLLTIVAVLGLLPSSKSLVSVIMYVRIPKFDEKIYREIEAQKGDVDVIYSMYLTSYKLNFPINAFAVRGNNLIGYTEFEKCNISACEEHIRDIFKQNGIKNITIKIFSDQKRFIERIDQLQELEAGKRESEILELLGDISL